MHQPCFVEGELSPMFHFERYKEKIKNIKITIRPLEAATIIVSGNDEVM